MSEGMSASATPGQASSGASSSPSAAQSSSSQSSQNQNQQAKSANPNAQGSPVAAAQRESQTQNAPPAPKKLGDQDMDALVTVKINGQTKELALKEVIKLQQLEQASHEKMRKAAEIERKAQELMGLDIDRFAQMRGLDLDSLAEERLAKKYELLQMSPEQRRLHELEQREAAREQEVGTQRSQLIEQVRQFTDELPPGIENATPDQIHHYLGQVRQIYQMTEANLEREFVDAWKSTGLPKTPFIGARMAFLAKNGKNENGEPLQISEAAGRVKEAYVNDLREFVSNLDAQAIHDTLGKEIIQKLRDFDVQRVTGQAASQPIQNQSPGGKPASEKKYLNQIEWRKAMGLS